jgi:hypothetical protein
LATVSPKLTVSVTDMLGKTVSKSDVFSPNGHFKFNTCALKNGLYLINVSDGKTNIMSKLNIGK